MAGVIWESGAWHWCATAGSCYIGWADHWQTMITGILAVGAAGWAATLARGQLQTARDQVTAARRQFQAQLDDQADRRTRALRAARASFPGVLTAICNHAEIVAKALNDSWPVADRVYPGENPAAHPYDIRGDIPRFPGELINPLQEVMQHADDDAVLERIASIFREAQVLDARTRPLARGVRITLSELGQYVLEAATLYARAESLFNFARGHAETVDAGELWPRVLGALNIMEIHTPSVRDLAREEQALGLPPGEADTQLSP